MMNKNKMNIKQTFHIISYLQYPFLVMGVLAILKTPYDESYLGLKDTFLSNFNLSLIFVGIGVSFSSLQDVTKTQNDFSKNIWRSRRKGKIALYGLTILIFFLFVIAGIGYFESDNKVLNEVATGLVVFAIGFLGLLKVAIEMYEYNQMSKQ